MKIKSYQLFLESNTNDLSKEEESIIKNHFYDRLDGEIIDGVEITENKEVRDWQSIFKEKDNSYRFQESWVYLDINGDTEYSSKLMKEKNPFFWDRDKEKEWEANFKRKNFQYYKTIVVNIFFKSDKIIPYLNNIYENLIDDNFQVDGFLVNAWHPKRGEWRFHISTKISNPFIESKNNLSELFK